MPQSNPVIKTACTPSSGWRLSVASRISKAYSPNIGGSWLALGVQPSYTASHRQAPFTARAVYSFPLVGEAAPLNWGRSAVADAGNGPPLMRRPSADAVAGNGGDGGSLRGSMGGGCSAFSPPPCPSPVQGEGI